VIRGITLKTTKALIMRKELKQLDGDRIRVRATFSRTGTKSGFKHPLKTLLFEHVRCADTQKSLCDHIWFTSGKGWESLRLVKGDIVEFEARVGAYAKGYRGCRAEDLHKTTLSVDYRLERPTKARKLSNFSA
jgi:hypothetical protein